jgi:transposase-like protein
MAVLSLCPKLSEHRGDDGERGVPVTYERVREWCHKFGSAYAARLKKKRARFGTKWHLDEVFIKMNRIQHYLWRAVDQNGAVIDILVQPHRDRWAALRFFRKLLDTAERAPGVIITDKLRSYAAAKKLILPLESGISTLPRVLIPYVYLDLFRQIPVRISIER